MSQALMFYVINEVTDDVKYCERIGMKPYKTIDKTLDHHTFQSIVQYAFKGYIYEVLESSQCYSDYMVVLMRLPKLSYDDLLNVAINSRHRDERIGATGILLKDYPKELEQSLRSMIKATSAQLENKKNIKRMTGYLVDLITDSQYIQQFENIRDLCKELSIL